MTSCNICVLRLLFFENEEKSQFSKQLLLSHLMHNAGTKEPLLAKMRGQVTTSALGGM